MIDRQSCGGLGLPWAELEIPVCSPPPREARVAATPENIGPPGRGKVGINNNVAVAVVPMASRPLCEEDHISTNFRLLRSKMRRLPPVHQATLKAIVEHLAKIASHSDKNKMDAKNLAIVFGSVIFGEDDMMPKGGDLLSMQSWKVR